MTDIQAAIGSAQMNKLTIFCEKRKDNFRKYLEIFKKYSQYFIFPEATPNSNPAWFSYIVTLKPDCPFSREEITAFFNEHFIETRNLFAGNMVKQPGFMKKKFRIHKSLKNTDYIMNHTFFLGTYPGLTEAMISYVGEILDKFLENR
jgi:CDP-6-deoxy-D-xylo-4-hexulose-3-dehydrase